MAEDFLLALGAVRLFQFSRLSVQPGNAKLACPGENRVLDLAAAGLGAWCIDPGAAVAHLPEDRRSHPIGAQVAAQNEQIDLEALVRRLRRCMPIRNDDATERIGGSERQEVERVEGCPPEVGVYPDPGPSPGFGGIGAAAQEQQAIVAEDAGLSLIGGAAEAVHPVRVIVADIFVGGGTAGRKAQQKAKTCRAFPHSSPDSRTIA